jgi:Ni/Fe-hydrogenase subunit HybB-like protein
MYKPTIVEFGLLIGTLGIFFTAFLLFIRIFPVISISEVKSILKTGDKNQHNTELNHEKTE